MVETYFKLVLAKKRTCNPNTTGVKLVPSTVIELVKALLAERGYDEDGNRI